MKVMTVSNNIYIGFEVNTTTGGGSDLVLRIWLNTMAWEATGLEENLPLLCPIHVVKLDICYLAEYTSLVL